MYIVPGVTVPVNTNKSKLSARYSDTNRKWLNTALSVGWQPRSPEPVGCGPAGRGGAPEPALARKCGSSSAPRAVGLQTLYTSQNYLYGTLTPIANGSIQHSPSSATVVPHSCEPHLISSESTHTTPTK